jgi:thiol-disulfide isomerase/thioredoxin
MKSVYRACAITLLSLLLLGGCSRQQPALHTSQGETISLAALQNDWIVVNYWAGWCNDCALEIPQLNAFYQQNKRNKNSHVVLLSVNYDALSPAELAAAVKKAGIEYPVLTQDVAPLWQLTVPDGLPATFILAPGGRLVKTIVGGMTAQALTATLHSLQRPAAQSA